MATLPSSAERMLQNFGGGSSSFKSLSYPPHSIQPPKPKPENAVTIAVSPRVLFHMEKEQQIYETQGMEDYIRFQVEHKTEPLSPGPAFSFVKVSESSPLHVCCTALRYPGGGSNVYRVVFTVFHDAITCDSELFPLSLPILDP